MSMYRLDTQTRVQIVKALCEGCSIRATCRMIGVSKQTVLTLLLKLGRVCLAHEDKAIRGVKCVQIEADEIWGFTHCKDKHAIRSLEKCPKGSVWTWYAVCARSKMILSWIMGDRDQAHGHAFMKDLASRLACRPQLSTDGLGVYAGAVAEAFHTLGVDYAQIHKVYSAGNVVGRYSPPQCIGCTKAALRGDPDMEKAGTSRVERANLTLRMSQRRWTRLTNAHSKSLTHMEAAFALHSCFYNWCRKHMSIGTTPAVAAGLADHVWSVEELVGLLEAEETALVGTVKNARGSYKPRASKERTA